MMGFWSPSRLVRCHTREFWTLRMRVTKGLANSVTLTAKELQGSLGQCGGT